MPMYRIGSIWTPKNRLPPSEILECSNDLDAVRQAADRLGAVAIEVREGERLVIYLAPGIAGENLDVVLKCKFIPKCIPEFSFA